MSAMSEVSYNKAAEPEMLKIMAGLLPEQRREVCATLFEGMTRESQAVVLERLLEAMTPEVLKVFLAKIDNLVAIKQERFRSFGAIEVTLDGQTMLAAVPEPSFGKSRSNQEQLAEQFGASLATHAQNHAVIEGLLRKENPTDAEKALMKLYKDKYVRDKESGFSVVRGNILESSVCNVHEELASIGALFLMKCQGC
jgi:hypothetical protein